MTLPAIVLGVMISTLYGAAFHLWRGGGAGRFLLYLVLAWMGFWIGHIVGKQLNWPFSNVGPLYLGPATLGSLLLLAGGFWLSLNDAGR